MPRGMLTTHQRQTLPEMQSKGVLFFICESVFDVFQAVCHIEKNVIFKDNFFAVKNEINIMPEWQTKLRLKLKL